MNVKKNSQYGLSIGLTVLLCAVVLYGTSCNLPEGRGARMGTLTLVLPRTGASRSVLTDDFIATLKYRVTMTNTSTSGIVVFDTEGGETRISLEEGVWDIAALAYASASNNPDIKEVPIVGSGSARVTIIAGQEASVTINMYVELEYEAMLLDVYIHNEAELRRIGAAGGLGIDNPDRIFHLVNDITVTTEGGPWTPIGDAGNPFKSRFEGNGHTITVKALGKVKQTGNETGNGAVYSGFFAVVEGAGIKDITIAYDIAGGMVDVCTGEGSEYGYSFVGGIAGCADNTTFENVAVTGSFLVKGDGDICLMVGGIVGTIGSEVKNNIRRSSFTGDLTANNSSGKVIAGGIAGDMRDTEITACYYAGGRIKAEAEAGAVLVGGIAGYIGVDSAINKSYALGVIETIAGTEIGSSGGGIAGQTFRGSIIENCYVWADVSSSSPLGGEEEGGIAGTNDGTISKCYAAGTVTSTGITSDEMTSEVFPTYVGGIAASGSGGVNACMSLVSELDAGSSESSSSERLAYAIGYSSAAFTGNYSQDNIVYKNSTVDYTASDAYGGDKTGGEQKAPGDFKNRDLYEEAGWTFDDGDWKFLSGYDYPVLSWQTAAPVVPPRTSLGDAGLPIYWP